MSQRISSEGLLAPANSLLRYEKTLELMDKWRRSMVGISCPSCCVMVFSRARLRSAQRKPVKKRNAIHIIRRFFAIDKDQRYQNWLIP